MTDKTFEWSLTALFILCVLWMIFGSVFTVLGILWSILVGLIVLICGGGALLWFWGKNYMSQT
jgi:hypothetical protein